VPLSERFRNQVALLIEVLPFVATESAFALKGGTGREHDEFQIRRHFELCAIQSGGQPVLAAS
jgi:hypothetical protein